MRLPVTLPAIGIALLAACSSSPPTGAPPPVPTAGTRVTATATAGPVTVTLSAEQIAAVRTWYGDSAQGRGRGRSGGLPPGIARNLERGKPLPPGIAKQYLPQDLVLRMPRIGGGLEYVIVAGKLLLIEAATQVVREVLLDAVFA